MRIVGGKHRGRRIEAPPGQDVRPTSDRAREALFNILIHGHLSADGTSPLPGARVLDAFAGSGALGLEVRRRRSCAFHESSRAARDPRQREGSGETASTTAWLLAMRPSHRPAPARLAASHF
jgi:16S rRNA (guanine966-N2)-methyltransferase